MNTRKRGGFYKRSIRLNLKTISRGDFCTEIMRVSQINYLLTYDSFIYRRPTLYPLEIAVDFLKSL
jgi:hypothetical protein